MSITSDALLSGSFEGQVRALQLWQQYHEARRHSTFDGTFEEFVALIKRTAEEVADGR